MVETFTLSKRNQGSLQHPFALGTVVNFLGPGASIKPGLHVPAVSGKVMPASRKTCTRWREDIELLTLVRSHQAGKTLVTHTR